MGALEDRLETIIDKSSKDLYNISAEYYSQKTQWEESRKSRPSRYPSMLPSPAVRNERYVFDHIVNELENTAPCGQYQQAAVNAFHAIRNGSGHHPMGGRAANDVCAAESRIKQDVDRLVNDKFKCTSIAIDALRDQLVILADEIRQLNRNSTSQERRVDAICHDMDSRRGIINTMEAHILDENSRMKSIGLEMARLKEEVAAKASLVDVKTGLKSSRLKSNASLSDVKDQLKRGNTNVMNEVTELKEWMQKQYSLGLEKQMHEISTSTQAFQRNLVDTMKSAVHEEVSLTEQKFRSMIELEVQKISTQSKGDRNKEYVKVISQIVTKAATEIESNLRNDLEKKVEKMIDAKLKAAREQDIGTIGNIMKELTTTELSTIQGSLNNLATKQEQFISRERAELLIESCRAQLAQSMNSLEEQLAKVTSKAIATSTSSSETMLQKWKIDHENVLARLQQFVTHDEASDIAEVASKEQFARSMTVVKEMDAKSELRIKAQIFECRQQMQGLTETTKDEAAFIARKICYEQCEQSDRATAHSIQTQIDACQTHLMNNLTMQLRNYTTKEEASEIAVIKSKIEADRCFQVTADRCHGTAGKLVDLEAKLEDIESDFSSEVFKLRSTVKSIDIRVDSLETNCIGETSVRNELSDNCVHLDSMKEEIGTLELCAAPSNGESVTEGIMLLQTSHRAHEDPPLMQYNLDTKVQGTLSCKPSDADSPVPFDDKSEYSATSESASERSCLSIRSGRDVTHNNNDLDEQCTLIQERNRMLSNVARTLSAVAARRDDPSLRRLAAELRAGKLATDSSKSQHDHEPPVHAASDVNVDQQSELSSPQSDVESIDTAHAMSLCGVQLDEYTDSTRADRISRSLESPESFVGTIDTAEAISLCRLHVPSDQYGENSALDTQSQVHLQLDDSFEDQCIPAEKNPPENSFTKSLSPSPSTSSVASGSLSLQHLIRQSLTWEGVEFPPSQMQSSEISPSQKSFVGAPSLPAACHRFDTCEVGEKNKSVVERDHMPSLVAVRIELPPEQFAPELLDDEIATGSTAIKHFPGSLQTESADTDDHRPSNIVHSEHDAPDTNKVEMNVPAYDTTEPQPLVNESVKNSSLPSDDFVLTPLHTFSCIEDEESLPGSLASADEVFDCNLLSYKYNPTRIHNPEPYWGWDALLSELKASGRTLRDGDSSDGSISSYGSKSFEGDKWR